MQLSKSKMKVAAKLGKGITPLTAEQVTTEMHENFAHSAWGRLSLIRERIPKRNSSLLRSLIPCALRICHAILHLEHYPHAPCMHLIFLACCIAWSMHVADLLIRPDADADPAISAMRGPSVRRKSRLELAGDQ